MQPMAEEQLAAWRRVTEGEPRWQASLAVLGAVALQLTLPPQVRLRHDWLLLAAGVILLMVLFIANPKRISRSSPMLRLGSMALIASISVANIVSATRLVHQLLYGSGPWAKDPAKLLFTGGAIWLTNVIVFALWYWEFDRGGPADRANAVVPYPDFMFPQMENPQLAPPDWEAAFVDYFYTSFTNAAAFSPTDVMPLTGWAKLIMMTQSAISLMVVALVVARAVNILPA
jgi:uncharacterized membrane protein